jgi:hypothetical protein
MTYSETERYSVDLFQGTRSLFSAHYRLPAQTPDGHYHVYALGRAAKQCHSIIDKTIDFDISLSKRAESNEPAAIMCNTGWLTVFFWGQTVKINSKLEQRIVVQLILLKQPDLIDSTFQLTDWYNLQLVCDAHDFGIFGEVLLSELDQAKAQREGLGIVDPGDAYI